jgi:hypothetical protein
MWIAYRCVGGCVGIFGCCTSFSIPLSEKKKRIQMSRQVEVTVPHHSARTVLDIISSSTLVSTVTHFTTQEAVRISFKVRPKHLQSVVDDLTKVGCGETYGTIDVFPLIMSRPVVEREKRVKRSYVISDRMTIDEIQVKSTCEILNSQVL